MIEDYVRNAELVGVVDGDTLDLDIDLGFRMWLRTRVRLLGVNCPEMHGTSKAAGLVAKAFTQEWAGRGRQVQVQTHLDKRDSFGRLLAVVCRGEDRLNEALLASGNAVEDRG